MTPQEKLLCLIPIAYLVGSIPFGLLVGLSRGIDPRKGGSGNIGATNVGRLLGGKYFALVTILDVCKSLIPLLLAAYILRNSSQISRLTYLLWLLVGFAAVLGHMFPIFLRFKGGKGVATGAGLMVGLFPHYTYPALFSIAIFLVVFYATRYMSLASMAGAASFPIMFIIIWSIWPQPIWTDQLPLTLVTIILATMVVYRHRGNIARLLAGTEPKFTKNPAV